MASLNFNTKIIYGLAMWAFLLSPAFAYAQQEVYQLDNDGECVDLIKNNSQMGVDKTGTLTIDQVAQGEDIEFRSVDSIFQDDLYGMTGTTVVYWIKVKLQKKQISSPADVDQWVLFNPRWIYYESYKTFYPAPEGKDSYVEVDYTARLDGTEPLSAVGYMPLSLNAKEVATIYVRLEDKSHFPPFLYICRAEQYSVTHGNMFYYLGVYLGIVLAVVLINIFMFWYVRDKSYLLYVLFHFAFALFFTLNTDLLFELLPATQTLRHWSINFILVFLVLSLAIAFTRSFLITRKYLGKWDKIGDFVTLFLVLFAAFGTPFLPLAFLDMTLNLAAIIIPILCVVAGVVCFRKGFKPARFFLVAWSVFAVGTSVTILTAMGVVPFTVWGINAAQTASALEAILLSVALADRVRSLKSQRKSAILEKNKAQFAQKETEERLRYALEATNDGIWDWNIDTDVLYLSPRCYLMLGYDIDAFSPSMKALAKIIHPDDWEKSRAQTKRCITAAEGQASFEVEFRLKRKDGTWAWVLDRGKVVERNENNAPSRMVGTLVDISDRKEAEQKMFQTDKLAALGQMMAGIAHEINNPNNFLYFNLPILKKYLDELQLLFDQQMPGGSEFTICNMKSSVFWEDAFKLIANMQHGSKRITDIVAELKDYVRSHDTDEKQSCSAAEIVGSAQMLIRKQVEKMAVRLDVEVADDLPPIWANVGKIEQVLINLVINAAHAAKGRKKPEVKFAAHLDDLGQKVVFSVSDNGIGIDDNIRQKIFDPFFTTKERHEGTGLGLSICQRITRDHGAEIKLKTQVDKGSTFFFSLDTAPV